MSLARSAGLVLIGLFATSVFRVAMAQAHPDRPLRQMEPLGRGVVASSQDDGKIFVSWRLLGSDPDGVAFNLYRTTGDEPAVKLNASPIANSTNYVDTSADRTRTNSYFVRAVRDAREQEASQPFRLRANSPTQGYLAIPLQTLPGHTPNDASVGDLDGDGSYEIVLKQEMRPRDNSQRGPTGETKLEAYTLQGAFLWRINLGKNIREGAHYTQFLVYDLDSDGQSRGRLQDIRWHRGRPGNHDRRPGGRPP